MSSDLAKGEARGGVCLGWLGVVCLGIAFGSVGAQQREYTAEQIIRIRRESSNRAIAAHDTAGIGAILAANVVVVSSNSQHTEGRDANVSRFTEQFRTRPDVMYRRTPSDVRVFEPWRMASERGQWTGSWTAADGKVEIGGSYFAKWRLVNDAWLVESETYVPERCSGSGYCVTPP